MRNILLFVISAALISCGSKQEEPKPFCIAPCQEDTIKFKDEVHQLKPYLYITANNCGPDSVIWSYSGLGFNRKFVFDDFGGHKFKLNSSNMSVYFKDTSYIWWLFNDCTNGRGYFAKIPFNKNLNINRTGRALNKFDAKFAVADGLAVHTDKGNLFVEEMSTGKKAMMTFGKELPDFDPDAVHESIDSVNITPTRIWVKVLIDKKWTPLEKNITLQ